MLNEQDLRESWHVARSGGGFGDVGKNSGMKAQKEGKEMRWGMTKKQRGKIGLRVGVGVGGCASRNRAAKEMETFKIRE